MTATSIVPPWVVGLIGGIGSGKSAVAAAFERHGARVIPADSLGHEALRQADVRQRLVSRWGPGILDDKREVNRKAVAALVFSETPEAPGELKALESIVFPYIEKRIREEVAVARGESGVRFVVLDAAILLEAGWDKACDRIVYVHTPRETRLRRLAEGRGWPPREMERRERVQLSLTEKATRATDAVDNSRSHADMANHVATLLKRWGL